MKKTSILKSLFLLVCASASACAQEKSPAEMLKNPSFEEVHQGNLPYWQKSAFAASSSTERASAGERSIMISSDTASFFPLATQEVKDFQKNQKYRLQYQARAAKFGQEYRVYIGVWKTDPVTKVKSWVDGIDTQWRQGLDGWQKIGVDFTIKKEADTLIVVLQVKGPSTVWFDDISLKPAVEENVTADLPPFVGSPQHVQILPDRTFRVKGKPFFPIMLWGWHPDTDEELAQARDAGFNLVTPTHIDGLGPAAFKLWLDAAARNDIMVMGTALFAFSDAQASSMMPGKTASMKRVIEVARTHPAFFAYLIADEPAWGGYNLNAYATGAALFRSLDPNHPIYVNHAPRNSIGELARYNRYSDIAGSDIYPVWKTGIDKHSDLPNKTISVVGDETTKNLQAVAGKKPIMQTLQGFSWSDNSLDPAVKDEPFPTQVQLRFMVYNSIVRGATGVAFFQEGRYSSVRPELKPICRELQAMSDVLAGGRTLDAGPLTKAKGIEVLVKEYNGKAIIIATNCTNQAVNGQFEIAALPHGSKSREKWNVLTEGRKVSIQKGILEDAFAPYAVHIYAGVDQDVQVLRQNKTKHVKPVDEAKIKAAALVRERQIAALAPATPNLALASNGTSVSASSLYTNNKVGVLIDGKRRGGVWNDGTRYQYPDWVALDFGKPVTLDKVIVYSHEVLYFNEPVNNGIRDYEVQVEKEGQWESVAQVKDNQEFARVIDLPKAVTTRKLRIWITATNGDQDWSRLQEIEVYGPKSGQALIG